jgi:hypothetical protein
MGKARPNIRALRARPTDRAQAPRTSGPAERARTEGVSELHVPRDLIATDAIPLLGAGKTDYAAARALVDKELDIAKASRR